MTESKPPGLPFAIAQRFVRDMKAFHVEHDALRRNEIAGGTLRMLREHYRKGLKLTDVKRMFARLHAELDHD
jgi:hypothetical protein